MMMKRGVICACGVAVASTAFGQNLVNNSSFEDPLGFDFSDLSNFNVFFDGFGGSTLFFGNNGTGVPNTGDAALTILVDNDGLGGGGIAGTIQSIPDIVEGGLYEIGAFVSLNGEFSPSSVDGAGDVTINFEFQDALGDTIETIGFQLFGEDLTDDFQFFSAQGVAPAGTVSGTVFIAGIAFGEPLNAVVDDVSVVLVPGPGAASILAAGGLLAARRRRA